MAEAILSLKWASWHKEQATLSTFFLHSIFILVQTVCHKLRHKRMKQGQAIKQRTSFGDCTCPISHTKKKFYCCPYTAKNWRGPPWRCWETTTLKQENDKAKPLEMTTTKHCCFMLLLRWSVSICTLYFLHHVLKSCPDWLKPARSSVKLSLR